MRPPPAGIDACIGNTPLVELRSLSAATGRTVLAKAEFLNGSGNSPKDCVALSMLAEAERAGLLVPHRGDTVYEGSVGSTGISLAALALARARGYRAHICMPDDQSGEKAALLLHLGAVVERVPVAPITSPDHFVNLARRRAAQHADGSAGFFADQFESPANWRAHRASTGPETMRQTGGGRLDAFVAGVRVVLVEGIGLNRATANLEAGRDLIDDAVRVSDDQACRMARWLVERDGLFVGSSTVVTVLCDSGTRHLSKFWKRIAELGLEDANAADLFADLGIAAPGGPSAQSP